MKKYLEKITNIIQQVLMLKIYAHHIFIIQIQNNMIIEKQPVDVQQDLMLLQIGRAHV